MIQVGKKLSELIRDSGSQASGTEQGRWQAELAQVAIELISVSTIRPSFQSLHTVKIMQGFTFACMSLWCCSYSCSYTANS